jgi:hypothetical protein
VLALDPRLLVVVTDASAEPFTEADMSDPKKLLPTFGKGGIVPYVALWSGERPSGQIVCRFDKSVPVGIAFADEAPEDRDSRGLLWNRTNQAAGSGRPDFAKIHPLRQRKAMRKLLCQVCAGPADTTEAGTLWLLTDYRDDWPGWPNGMGNTYPPLCLPCARLSVRQCPVLRKGHVVVRAHADIGAVEGQLYVPGAGRLPVRIGEATLLLDDPRLPWLLVSDLVRRLRDCELIDLDDQAVSEERRPR